MNRRVYKWAEIVQSWLIPPVCVLCGDEGRPPSLDLCQACEEELPANTRCCGRCAIPLDGGASVCGRCLQDPPQFDRVIAPLLYQYPVDRMIIQFKFHRRLAMGRVLAELLGRQIRKRENARTSSLIPVPLHASRYRRRGFNQALEIARIVSKSSGIPCDWRCCRRVRATVEQTALDAKSRGPNVRGAFAVRDTSIEHAVIVDDVMTTGSTVNEIAGQLRRSGVRTVEVWVLARAF